MSTAPTVCVINTHMDQSTLLAELFEHHSVQDKVNIGQTYELLGDEVLHDNYLTNSREKIKLGDDCAAIKDGKGGYLLFAAEGIINSFIKSHPWFAGYSAVMVNISDICSMGGLPLAITDVLWAQNRESAKEIWEGMLAASQKYNVPIVGGHTCYQSENNQVAVSILGSAEKLLTSFHAKPEEDLVMVVDINGAYFEDYPFWNASTNSTAERLQELIKLPKLVAESGLSKVAKDISMGGVIGTADMLCKTSNVGLCLDLELVPKPEYVDLKKWLISFPSYGFLFSCDPSNSEELCGLFHDHKISAKVIGKFERELGIRSSPNLINTKLTL
ncbi:MAG: sll0787 family AIR synthase-like protein [Cyclobacteriaceae bacterium]